MDGVCFIVHVSFKCIFFVFNCECLYFFLVNCGCWIFFGDLTVLLSVLNV